MEEAEKLHETAVGHGRGATLPKDHAVWAQKLRKSTALLAADGPAQQTLLSTTLNIQHTHITVQSITLYIQVLDCYIASGSMAMAIVVFHCQRYNDLCKHKTARNTYMYHM